MSFGDSKDIISDASQFEVEFKTRNITFRGQLFISIMGNRQDYRFHVDKLSEDLSDLISQYVKDHMQEYVTERETK